jgi:hypothetical protein
MGRGDARLTTAEAHARTPGRAARPRRTLAALRDGEMREGGSGYNTLVSLILHSFGWG